MKTILSYILDKNDNLKIGSKLYMPESLRDGYFKRGYSVAYLSEEGNLLLGS